MCFVMLDFWHVLDFCTGWLCGVNGNRQHTGGATVRNRTPTEKRQSQQILTPPEYGVGGVLSTRRNVCVARIPASGRDERTERDVLRRIPSASTSKGAGLTDRWITLLARRACPVGISAYSADFPGSCSPVRPSREEKRNRYSRPEKRATPIDRQRKQLCAPHRMGQPATSACQLSSRQAL
jgi:hypothetical protein